MVQNLQNLNGLNPLYCGVYLLTLAVLASGAMLGLNPLYCGVYLLTESDHDGDASVVGLNPLYCGVYLLTHQMVKMVIQVMS